MSYLKLIIKMSVVVHIKRIQSKLKLHDQTTHQGYSTKQIICDWQLTVSYTSFSISKDSSEIWFFNRRLIRFFLLERKSFNRVEKKDNCSMIFLFNSLILNILIILNRKHKSVNSFQINLISTFSQESNFSDKKRHTLRDNDCIVLLTDCSIYQIFKKLFM